MADGSAKSASRAARLEARTTAEVLDQLKRAAALQGRSVSDFVVAAALEAAQKTIVQTELIHLSARDSRAFAAAILDSPDANDALRKAVARRREFMGD